MQSHSHRSVKWISRGPVLGPYQISWRGFTRCTATMLNCGASLFLFVLTWVVMAISDRLLVVNLCNTLQIGAPTSDEKDVYPSFLQATSLEATWFRPSKRSEAITFEAQLWKCIVFFAFFLCFLGKHLSNFWGWGLSQCIYLYTVFYQKVSWVSSTRLYKSFFLANSGTKTFLRLT